SHDELQTVRTHPLGRYPCARRPVPSRIFSWAVLSLPPYTALGNADSWVHLLIDGQREHQRYWAQFHSQPLLSLNLAQSPVWSHSVNRMLLFADLLRRGPYAASQRECRPAR